MEEENKIITIDENELDKQVTEGTKEIVADIATVENQDDFKRLIDLFNLNQSKKNALRMVKLNGLLEKIDSQILERFDKRPDQMSNIELLDFLKAVENSVDRSQRYVDKIEEKPMIQIIDKSTNINVEANSTLPSLDKDSKQKVLDLVASLMKDVAQPSSDIIDYTTTEEVNEDDEEDDIVYVDYSEGEEGEY